MNATTVTLQSFRSEPTDNTSGVLANIEDAVNKVFEPLTKWSGEIIFWSPSWFPMPWIVLWLIVAAVFITIYLGAIQARGLKPAYRTLRGEFSRDDDPGEIPHYQALTSAVSGTVGLGNIAGVGAAVTIGGAGATFWMILAGLFGMATKFAECTLGVKYREVRPDGTVSGGPFRYLPEAFKRFPKPLSVGLTGLFAVAILFFGVGGGNMFQANQTYAQAVTVTGGDDSFLANKGAGLVFGIGLAFLIGLVIIGGMKSIGRVTSTLVPVMGTIYLAACLVVILMNVDQVPSAMGDIVSGALSPQGVSGGFIGVLIVGMQRAAFSNEAGLGSAPIAHSTVKTRRPVSEGFVAMFEPFIDTVVVCTMTALTIVIAKTQFWTDTQAKVAADSTHEYGGGVAVTSDAFEQSISWFPYVLALAVALFAISTLITWSYYGNRAWAYLFGESKTSTLVYRVVFLTFTVAGCILTFQNVLDFADAFLFVCAFVNLLGVYLLLPVIKREMKAYLADYKNGTLAAYGAGEIDYEDTSATEVDHESADNFDGRQVGIVPDPDDDGFGRGAATVPYTRKGIRAGAQQARDRQQARHEERRRRRKKDEDAD
ncbi:sodium:alanine symporter family protein [Yimella sp. cx-51]|uniref:alanine/glycine:cation symporter family protein n=1 Tax=Yimella sp. cx-51 TaxID=2770551 RepID=UPI00165D4D68|nr:alanine/glycine:cation symporter family protein [Yimella sp. cx-51]MBC9957349.1 alanine:cation symporter family protein [Yimella sp. cx-51]QTH39407.1 alanine:cation symporter family protein [Yimella sp. cx-51]